MKGSNFFFHETIVLVLGWINDFHIVLSKIVVLTIHYKNVAPLSSLFLITAWVLFQDTLNNIFCGNLSVHSEFSLVEPEIEDKKDWGQGGDEGGKKGNNKQVR